MGAGAGTIRIVPLTGEIDVGGFDCGEPERNRWLAARALANQQRNDSRTYVALDGESGRVIGFYALAVGSILRGGLRGAARRNAPDPVGCALLAQLAVGRARQGAGLGRVLVLHAMGQAVRVADLAGCRLFAVHPARDDLAAYYARFGFLLMPTTPKVMVMRIAEVRGILAAVAGAAG